MVEVRDPFIWRSTSPKALHDTIDSGSVEYSHADDLTYEIGVLLPTLGVDFYLPT